jgi:chromatin assembly factor 1 subunit B
LEDILDICWSRDGSMLISGSVDNSAIVWNTLNGNKIAIVKEPKGFVQGVTFDPLGNYYAVMSTDRSLRYYSTNTNKCIFNVNKITINNENSEVSCSYL